jgi:hypothetical protein
VPEEAVKYVNGRRAMLQALDVLWSEDKNIRAIAAAVQEHLEAHPLEHLKLFIYPLLPKTENLDEEKGDMSIPEVRIIPAPPKTDKDKEIESDPT